MAAHARLEHPLLVFRARDTLEPFRVRQLGLHIQRRAEGQIDSRRSGRPEMRCARAVELVADRADAERMRPRLQPVRGKAIPAVGIGHHADRNGGAFPLRGDDDPLHGTFHRRSHLASKCDLSPCAAARD